MKRAELDIDAEEEMLVLQNEARSVKTSFSLRPSVEKRLRNLAEKIDVPMSSIVDRALKLYLNAIEKSNP